MMLCQAALVSVTSCMSFVFNAETLWYDLIIVFHRADADIPEVVNFNNRFLYYYYGLLRMCCIRSEAFAQRLALHTNTDFAFKQFLPSPAVYPEVSEELFVLLEIFAGKRGTSSNSPEAVEAANQFRKHIIPVFVHDVDGQNWAIWLK